MHIEEGGACWQARDARGDAAGQAAGRVAAVGAESPGSDCCPIIAVLNRKGGAAKTTAVQNLGGLWGGWGRRILLVDLDTQFSLTARCGYPRERQAAGGDWLTGGAVEAALWPIPTMPGCTLLPSGAALETGLAALAGMRLGRATHLWEQLRGVRAGFDAILIDTKPDLDVGVTSAIAAASHLLYATLLEEDALDGVERSCHLAEDVAGALQLPVAPLGFLPVGYNRSGRKPEMLAALVQYAADLGITCVPPIPHTAHVGKERLRSLPMALAYPRSGLAEAYRLAAAVIGDLAGLAVPAETLAEGQRRAAQLHAAVCGDSEFARAEGM